jgi:hypothetical protein
MNNLGEPAQLEVRVAILTAAFQIRGTLRIIGTLQTYMNDDQKATLIIYGAEVTGVEASNPVRMTQPELIINKRAVQIILFEEMPPQGALTLLPRGESLVMYLDGFAAAGKFYMGQDARISDFADASLQQFLVITDMKVYPIQQVRSGLITNAPLGMIHKSVIRFYHQA